MLYNNIISSEIFHADFGYVFSFSLARQCFEIQKTNHQFHEHQMKQGGARGGT